MRRVSTIGPFGIVIMGWGRYLVFGYLDSYRDRYPRILQAKAVDRAFAYEAPRRLGDGAAARSPRIPQKVQLECHYGIRIQKQCHVGLLCPNSMVSLQLDLLARLLNTPPCTRPLQARNEDQPHWT